MGPETFDCAGLAWFLYFTLFDINLFKDGYGLSTTTRIMTNCYGQLTVFNEDLRRNIAFIRMGDILFFHRQSLHDNEPKIDNYYPGHCGIYLNNRSFIHASRPKGKVVISNFDNNPYWLDILVGSKNIISNDTLILRKK